MPSRIATPPPRGLGFAWIFLPPGLSTKPSRGARRIMTKVIANERTKLAAVRQKIGRSMRARGTRAYPQPCFEKRRDGSRARNSRSSSSDRKVRVRRRDAIFVADAEGGGE